MKCQLKLCEPGVIKRNRAYKRSTLSYTGEEKKNQNKLVGRIAHCEERKQQHKSIERDKEHYVMYCQYTVQL